MAAQEDLLIDDDAFQIYFMFLSRKKILNIQDAVFVTPETTFKEFLRLAVKQIKTHQYFNNEVKKYAEDLEPEKIKFVRLPGFLRIGIVKWIQKGQARNPADEIDPEETTIGDIGMTAELATRDNGSITIVTE